ncbi:SpoIIE family protein phosphatase [Streptomyces sp. NPDC046931]|uniref:SpoIIE family protein phosphatase n=1 Tax=Streptomyces sp. NPDC046931 TaxID=3154806 RepID=UPI00340B5C56
MPAAPPPTAAAVTSTRALAPPLGPIRHLHYRQQEITVDPGTALVLYTDGLVERRGEAIDVGLPRLRRLAEDTRGLNAEEICGLLLHERPDTELPDAAPCRSRASPAARRLPEPWPGYGREPVGNGVSGRGRSGWWCPDRRCAYGRDRRGD